MDNLTEQLKKYKRSLKAYAKKIKESGGKYRMRGEGREVAGASHVVCSFFFSSICYLFINFFFEGVYFASKFNISDGYGFVSCVVVVIE